MIEKTCDTYSLMCDYCVNEVDQDFDEFMDAVRYKKANGWKSKNEDGAWYDVCPDCAKLSVPGRF